MKFENILMKAVLRTLKLIKLLILISIDQKL